MQKAQETGDLINILIGIIVLVIFFALVLPAINSLTEIAKTGDISSLTAPLIVLMVFAAFLKFLEREGS